jgi:23S rRNA (uracil1939-C5)-methyltransferase
MENVCKLRFESIAAGGAAVARLDGKTVFAEGGAPDDVACCRITEEHKTYAKAELLEIIEASPVRIKNGCAFYGACGGCNLQHIDYNAQLVAKTGILAGSFIRIAGFCPPTPEVFPSPAWEYRNRMQFHKETAHGGGAFGLKGRQGIIAVSDCPVAAPGIRSLLQGGGKAISLPPDKDRFTVYSKDGLLLNEGGQERGKIRLLDREITVDAGAFFQSNSVMLEKLLAVLLEIAGGADSSLPMADLYAGVGTFALFLGGLFSKTDLAEENKKALNVARENLKGREAAFYASRDADWAKEAKRRKAPYSFIVADPPRSGLAPRLAAWLAEAGPPLLAYVSCDTASLARDSQILTRGGYVLKSLYLFDFYPQTAHIESLAVFEKRAS